MPPRVERATRTPPERRALQDALAWPIASSLLVGAALVFILPRIVPARFLALAVGGVFAVVTISLVGILAWVVERWLKRHAFAMAQNAEAQVQALGVAGLPAANADSALIPVASAFADAGARAALSTAEREMNESLAQLGSDAAAATQRAADAVRVAIDNSASNGAMGVARAALRTVDECAIALRHVTAAVPVAVSPVDVVALIPDALSQLPHEARARVSKVVAADRGTVLVEPTRFTAHLRELLELALHASPPDGVVTLHVSRLFRANIEETPVRRTGDSRLTIVPRSWDDSLRTWVQRDQPGAEVLSIVITDAGPPPTSDGQQRAFDAFAFPRPNDALGVTLATVRRTIAAAKGTIFLETSREGGTAVHLLLPIVATG